MNHNDKVNAAFWDEATRRDQLRIPVPTIRVHIMAWLMTARRSKLWQRDIELTEAQMDWDTKRKMFERYMADTQTPLDHRDGNCVRVDQVWQQFKIVLGKARAQVRNGSWIGPRNK